jgi:hypothetical protein
MTEKQIKKSLCIFDYLTRFIAARNLSFARRRHAVSTQSNETDHYALIQYRRGEIERKSATKYAKYVRREKLCLLLSQ